MIISLPSSNTTSPLSPLSISYEEEEGGVEILSPLRTIYCRRRSNLKKSIIQKDEDDVVGITLEKDTFTMMMAANLQKNKISWFLGFLCFVTQCSLISLVFIGENNKDLMPNRSSFDMPIIVPDSVRIGQFFAMILCLFNSADVIGSIQNLTMLSLKYDKDETDFHWGEESKHIGTDSSERHVLFEGNRSFGKWLIRVFVPLFLKLLQGILVLLVSTLVIMRADNIIDLLKDYTALIVISEIDDAVFLLAKHGYLGNRLQQSAHDSEEVEVQDQKVKKWRTFMFLSLVFLLFGLYSTVIYYQNNMIFLDNVYPYCRQSFEQQNGRSFTIQDLHELSNGKCDNFQGYGANINLCGFENDECRDLNDDYPDCNPVANALNERIRRNIGYRAADLTGTFISTMHSAEISKGDFPDFKPVQIGDGVCHKELDTLECNFDGNDCTDVTENDDCNTIYRGDNYKFKLGDGECDIFMNTEECDWDSGDCLIENELFDIKAYGVDCGSHKALTCGQCAFAPGGKIDPDLCGGDCEWGPDNFCLAKKVDRRYGIECFDSASMYYYDVFAKYSQNFLNALEDKQEQVPKSMPYFEPGENTYKANPPNCGICVYEQGLFTSPDNCGSKNDDGTIMGPDCFWNDLAQECQHLNTVDCSEFKEQKSECNEFVTQCFFNEIRNLCEDKCSKFNDKDCANRDFCHYDTNERTCKQAFCNDFVTDSQCSENSHCIIDASGTCSYQCQHISMSTCENFDHCKLDRSIVVAEMLNNPELGGEFLYYYSCK